MLRGKVEFAMFDYETTLLRDGKAPRTKFIGFYDGESYRRFKSTKEFEKFLRQSKQRYVLLHHGNFDLIQALHDGADVKIFRSHESRIIRGLLAGHSTQNVIAIFPCRLADLFAVFGHKKTSLKNLSKRNYEDCVLGLDCVLKLADVFEKVCGVNPLHAGTIANAAMLGCEKVAGRMPCDNRFESAYRGGRVEVFRYGVIKDADSYDINSTYPFSMLDAPQKTVLVHAWVEVRDFYCPFFCEDVRERLVFPNGTFRTWIFEDTLERYILPHVERVRIKPICKVEIDLSWLCEVGKFAKKIYEMRLKYGRASAIGFVAKIFLNSIYGRFALRGEREHVYVGEKVPAGDAIWYELSRKKLIAFKRLAQTTKRRNFPFAAYITDNARARLYKAFVQNDAYYGDTDCIWKNSKNEFVGEVGDAIGQWKKAGKTYTGKPLKIYGLKDYVCPKGIVRKGGSDALVWTLKQFAAHGVVKALHRARLPCDAKRVLEADGRTVPIIISY